MVPVIENVAPQDIEAFCQKWKIVKLAVFGSALREDFSDKSDIDLLVAFASDADWGLLDHVAMQQELRDLFGRKVDLITERSIRNSSNPLRKKSILSQAESIFENREILSDATR